MPRGKEGLFKFGSMVFNRYRQIGCLGLVEKRKNAQGGRGLFRSQVEVSLYGLHNFKLGEKQSNLKHILPLKSRLLNRLKTV